jgi:hypothetical protein
MILGWRHVILRCRGKDLGFIISELEFRIRGLGLRVQGSGFMV